MKRFQIDESDNPPDPKPKSDDNLKQIIIGIVLLGVIVYATYGLISRRFGFDIEPSTASIEKTFTPDSNIHPLKTDSVIPSYTPENSGQKTEPVIEEPVSNNQVNSNEVALRTKPQPIKKVSQQSKSITPQTTENSGNVTSSKTDESTQALTHSKSLSIAGKWLTDNREHWQVSVDDNDVTIKVYDDVYRYRHEMTGQLNGKMIILTNQKPGARGQGTLIIRDDGKYMSGKVKFRVTFNNYQVTRIED